MEFEFSIGDKTKRVSVEFKDGLYQVGLGDKRFLVDCSPISSHCFSMLIKDKVYNVFIADGTDEKYVALKGIQYRLKKPALQQEVKYASSSDVIISDGLISTPMPGKIVKVMVKKGERVQEGQSLIIVESMKMENDICSPFDGKVASINVSPGDLAQPGESLVELERI